VKAQNRYRARRALPGSLWVLPGIPGRCGKIAGPRAGRPRACVLRGYPHRDAADPAADGSISHGAPV